VQQLELPLWCAAIRSSVHVAWYCSTGLVLHVAD